MSINEARLAMCTYLTVLLLVHTWVEVIPSSIARMLYEHIFSMTFLSINEGGDGISG